MLALKAVRAAFSMYSRIPAGRAEFDEKSFKYALCAFPLIGAAIGMAELAWAFLCRALGFDTVLYAAAAAAIPAAISGGIHMDGYLDTTDALNSFGDTKKKLEILKDPNSGAFAVIGGVIYFMIYFALFTEIKAAEQLAAVCCGYVLSRALSAAGAVCFKSARPSGMLGGVSGASKKRAVIVSACAFIAVFGAAAVTAAPVCGICTLAAAALAFAHYRLKAYKEFGGVTGDLAGWFLQRCELAVLAAAVISWRVVCIL